MSKICRSFLAVFLVLALVLSCVPATVLAAEPDAAATGSVQNTRVRPGGEGAGKDGDRGLSRSVGAARTAVEAEPSRSETGSASLRFYVPQGYVLRGMNATEEVSVGTTVTMPTLSGGISGEGFAAWLTRPFDGVLSSEDIYSDEYDWIRNNIYFAGDEFYVAEDTVFYPLTEHVTGYTDPHESLDLKTSDLSDWSGFCAINGYNWASTAENPTSDYFLTDQLSAKSATADTTVSYDSSGNGLLEGATDELLFEIESTGIDGDGDRIYTVKSFSGRYLAITEDGELTLVDEVQDAYATWEIWLESDHYCTMVWNRGADYILLFNEDTCEFSAVSWEESTLDEPMNLYLFCAAPIDYEYCISAGNEHSVAFHEEVPPTCTAPGSIAYYTCDTEDCALHSGKYYTDPMLTQEVTRIDVLPMGHVLQILPASDATCTEPAYTMGCICSRCNTVLSAQIAIPPALGHDIIIDAAVAPSCTEPGLTQGEHCTRCDYMVAQEEIPALGHDIVIDEAVAPSCTEPGLTQGEHCSRCDYTIEQEEIPALGHDIITDEAVAPSCTEPGLTEGCHCDRCGEVLAAQEEIPALGHIDEDGNGICDVCEDEIIVPPAKPVVIYYPRESKVMTTEEKVSGVRLQLGAADAELEGGVVYTDAGNVALFYQIDNGDGTVSFKTEDGKYLYADSKDVKFVDAEEENTKFVIEEADGGVYIRCATANYSGRAQYLEFYSGCFTVYGMGTDPSIYVFNLYPVAAPCDHDWGEGVQTTAPDCENAGEMTFTCTVCGATYTEAIAALGHDIVIDEAVAPSCTEPGLTQGEHCSRCDYRVAQEEIPALGHVDEDGDGNCDVCGKQVSTAYYTELPEDGDAVVLYSAQDGVIMAWSFAGEEDEEGYYTSWNQYTEEATLDGYTLTAAHDYAGVFYAVDNGDGTWTFVDQFYYDYSEYMSCLYNDGTFVGTCGDPDYDGEYCCYELEAAANGYLFRNVGSGLYLTIGSDGLFYDTADASEATPLSFYVIDLGDDPDDCLHENTELVNAADATCLAYGYTGDICCADCGTLLEEGTELLPLGHDFGEWITDAAATVYREGSEHRDCSRCEQTETRSLPIIEIDYETNTEYGLAVFTVVHAQTLEPIKNAQIFISTPNDGDITLVTDENGNASAPMPVGRQIISACAEGCNLRNLTVNVKPGINNIPRIGLSDLPTYDAQITSSLMTLEEIEEAGIDVSAAGNQHVFEYELTLEFDAQIDAISILAYFGADGTYFGGSSGPSGGGGGGGTGGGGGGGGGFVGPGRPITVPTDDGVYEIYPISEYFYLIIRGNVHWLKEMFHVEMLVINNSLTDTLDGLCAELTLPEGLSLAEMVGEQQTAAQTIDHIAEGESETLHWYVRGDTAGSYSLQAHLTGMVMPFEEEIDDLFISQDALQVYAGNALHLDFTVPDSAFYGDDYPITITLTNVSDIPLYNVSHMIQVEQGMVYYYEDGTTEERIEYSDWEGCGTPVLNPGDSIVIETSVNIFFESRIIQRMIDSMIGLIDDIEQICHIIDFVELINKMVNGLVSCVTNCADALSTLDYSAVDPTGKIDLARKLYGEISGFASRYMTTGNKVLDAAISAGNTALLTNLNMITQDPDKWLAESSYDDIKAMYDSVTALGNAVAEEKHPSASFNVFDSLRSLISAIPVRFVLSNVTMTESEDNTTSIPWSVHSTPVGPRYFGVSNISKYLFSVVTLAFADELEDAIPFYPLLNRLLDDPMSTEEALEYVIATQNEIEQFKAKDATGEITFRSYIVRNDSSRSLRAADTEAFLLSSDNSTAVYENGVLTFTGEGTINVTPLTADGGTLVVEDSEGNTYRFVIDVVAAHECAPAPQEVIVPPTAAYDGYAIRRCEICQDILQIVPLPYDECCSRHSFGAPVIISDATCTTGGMINQTCTVCGYTETSFTDALGHSYANGVCIRCGEIRTGVMTVCSTTVTAEPDGMAVLPIYLSGNTGFAGFTLQISADDGLTLTNISKGDLLKDSDDGLLTKNVVRGLVNWSSQTNLTEDGELLVLTFAVDEDITPGEKKIWLRLQNNSPMNFADEHGAAVPVSLLPSSVIILPERLPQIRTASLQLGTDIHMIYTATVPEGFTDPYMTFTYLGNDYTVEDYTVGENGEYCFDFGKVNPQCMGENISATLHASLNGTDFPDTVEEYSVRTYCVNQLGKTNDEVLRTLLSDILTYGAAAQVYMDYKADALVTDGLALTPSTFTALSGKAVSFTGEQDEATCWTGAALVLSDDLAARFTFAAEDTDGLTIEVSVNGRTQTFDAFEAAAGGMYSVTFDGITATEFDDTVTATFYRNGEQIGAAVNYSVNTYICNTQNSTDTALAALVQALYNYGAAAEAYAATLS